MPIIGVSCPVCGHITDFHCRYDPESYLFVCQVCLAAFCTDLKYNIYENNADHSCIVEDIVSLDDICIPDDAERIRDFCLDNDIDLAYYLHPQGDLYGYKRDVCDLVELGVGPEIDYIYCDWDDECSSTNDRKTILWFHDGKYQHDPTKYTMQWYDAMRMPLCWKTWNKSFLDGYNGGMEAPLSSIHGYTRARIIDTANRYRALIVHIAAGNNIELFEEPQTLYVTYSRMPSYKMMFVEFCVSDTEWSDLSLLGNPSIYEIIPSLGVCR